MLRPEYIEIHRQPGYLRQNLPGYEPSPIYLRAVLSNQTSVGRQKDHYDSETELANSATLEADLDERGKFRVALTDLMGDIHRVVLRRPFNIDSDFLARFVILHQLLPADLRASNGTEVLVRWTKEPALKGIDNDEWGNLHFLVVNSASLTGGIIPDDVLEGDLSDERFAITSIMDSTMSSLPKGAEVFSCWLDNQLKFFDKPINEVIDDIEDLPSVIEDDYGNSGISIFIANVAGRLKLPSIPETLEEVILQYKEADIRIDRPKYQVLFEDIIRKVNDFSEGELIRFIHTRLNDADYSKDGPSPDRLVEVIYRLLRPPQQETIRRLIIKALADMANNPSSIWTEYAADHLLLLPVDVLIEHGQSRAKAIPHLLKIVEDTRFIPKEPWAHKRFDSFDFHLRAMQTLIGLQYSPDEQDFWKRLYQLVPQEHRDEDSYRGLVIEALTCYGLKPALEWILEVSDKSSIISNIEQALIENTFDSDFDPEERAVVIEGIISGLPTRLAYKIKRALKKN